MHPHDRYLRYALRRAVECSLTLDEMTRPGFALPPPDLDLDLVADDASFFCDRRVSSTADRSISDEEPFFLLTPPEEDAPTLTPLCRIDDDSDDPDTDATDEEALASIMEMMFCRGRRFMR